MNKILKLSLAVVIALGACFGLPHPSSAGNSRVDIPVLVYHRVGYSSDPLTITPERLNHDLSELDQNGYQTVSLPVFEAYMAGKAVQLPANPILLTFDDAYGDNYDHAFPLLKAHHDVATFFVITGLVDRNPDRLTSSQILEMAAAGMSFGSHTVTHTPLSQESEERMRNELAYSKQFLEELLGTPITTIAYPEGSYNALAIRIAGELGYDMGFSVKSGVCTRQDPSFIIPRIAIFHFTGDVLDAINRA
jgi:peptidoglycan/xylan/chitin deacetylase (PgdA/CDA1 family)